MPDTALDADIHVGDIGTALVVTVTDEDDAVVNIATASPMTIYLTKPRVGTAAPVTLTKTAVLDSTGTDGKMKYVTISGDLSVAGTWKIQGRVTIASARWSTREGEFTVRESRGGV